LLKKVLACTMMAAMVGVIGASEVTMGVLARPQMPKRQYGKFIACGSILVGGTVGILISPLLGMRTLKKRYPLFMQQTRMQSLKGWNPN